MAKTATALTDLVRDVYFPDGKAFNKAKKAAVEAIRQSELKTPQKELIARLAEAWNTETGCGLARLGAEALGLPVAKADELEVKRAISRQLDAAVEAGYLREIPQERGHYRLFDVLLSQIPGITGVPPMPASMPANTEETQNPARGILAALGIPVTEEKDVPPWHDDALPEEFETGTEVTSAAEDSLERLLQDLREIHPDWALWKRVRL